MRYSGYRKLLVVVGRQKMFFFGDEFFKVGKALFGIAQKLFFFLFGDGVLVLIGS